MIKAVIWMILGLNLNIHFQAAFAQNYTRPKMGSRNCSSVTVSSEVFSSTALPWGFDWRVNDTSEAVVLVSVTISADYTQPMIITPGPSSIFSDRYSITNTHSDGLPSTSVPFVSTITLTGLLANETVYLSVPGLQSDPIERVQCSTTPSGYAESISCEETPCTCESSAVITCKESGTINTLCGASGEFNEICPDICNVTWSEDDERLSEAPTHSYVVENEPVTRSCGHGFEGSGTTYTCTSNNIVETDVNCSPVFCLINLTSQQMSMIGTNVTTVTYNAPQSYSCVEGYTGSNASISCTASKSAQVTFNCTKVNCPIDANEYFSMIGSTVTSLEYNNTVSYDCVSGYTGPGASIFCGSGGIASISVNCTPVVCPVELSELEVAAINMNITSVSKSKLYDCADDFVGTGLALFCEANGTSFKELDCKEKEITTIGITPKNIDVPDDGVTTTTKGGTSTTYLKDARTMVFAGVVGYTLKDLYC